MLEIIDNAPRKELAARDLKNLGALRHSAVMAGLLVMGGLEAGAYKTDPSGFYLNGEQVIAFGPITEEHGYFKQTAALYYLEGGAE